MAVGAVEAKVDALDRRMSDLRSELQRADSDRRAEIARERDRVDDVFDAQLALSVANAKTQTAIRFWGSIVALVTPMLVALGVWLVMRSFTVGHAPAPTPMASIATFPIHVPATARSPVATATP